MSDIQSNPDRQPKTDQKDMLNKAYQDMEIENGMQLIENYKHVYRINWRSHLLWTLAVICFILSRLWWLVPLPGSDYLPAYRTYPATFLTTFFQTIACACATRSLTVGLVKCFSKGIRPDSVVRYGETGGFGSIWSAFRHRSGLRYFFLASLVTMAILLGDALEGELQSSVTIYQRAVGMGMQNMVHGHTALPVTDTQANANLASIEVIRYTTSEGKEAILIYGTSNSTGPFAAGVFVSATATNYTCSGRDCQQIDPAYTLPPNNKAIADALADAIRSNAGLYGTSVAHGLPLDMINGVNVTQSGGLVDALYANANCQTPEMTLSEAMMLFTYSAAHWTWLSLLWVLLYVIIWLIGVYLIGYSEETWSRIARKGFMLPQIIRNSPTIFKSNISGEVVDEKAWLVPEQGVMILDSQAKHGYTVTEEEIPIQ
ncbi:hypothetical protein EDC96DRAFT_60505 [Choanephora cucurbitarum]|nr:hypothetical protein EDC96DRAFT_60505 [Choanephora cucurbitarum]